MGAFLYRCPTTGPTSLRMASTSIPENGGRLWRRRGGRRHSCNTGNLAARVPGRGLLHAEHADGRALRGTIARVDSNPSGIEPAQGPPTHGAVPNVGPC